MNYVEPPKPPRRVVSANLVWDRRKPPWWEATLVCGHTTMVYSLKPWDPAWVEPCGWCVEPKEL